MAYDDDLVDPYTYARLPDDTGPTALQDAQDDALVNARIPENMRPALSGGDDYQPPVAPPPDPLVGDRPQGAPPTGLAGVKLPPDAAPDAVSFTAGAPEDAAPPDASIVGELGSGLARGFKHTAAEVGDLAATAASKTGDWTDTTWLKNLGSTISDYDKGLTKVDPSAISSMTMAQARAKGVMTAWLVGKAAEQAVPLTSIIAMGTAMPLAPIIYGAAVGANEEAKNPDATGGSVATAAIGNAAMMGMPIHILQSAVGQTFFKKLAVNVMGFAGLGAAGEFQEPATKAARGEGFDMPSGEQLVQGAVVGGLGGALAQPIHAGLNRVIERVRGKAGQPPPPVDADVQAATQQAVNPPDLGGRTEFEPSPRGPADDTMGPTPPPAGVPRPSPPGPLPETPPGVRRPVPPDQTTPEDFSVGQPPGVDPDAAAAMAATQPATQPTSRLDFTTPPRGAAPPGTGRSDFAPSPRGPVDDTMGPTPPPAGVPRPPPAPEPPPPAGPDTGPADFGIGRPAVRDVAPLAPDATQGELPGIEPPPAQGELPLRQPPPLPDTGTVAQQPELPLGDQQLALPMKLSQPEQWRIEPDDATPGQYVVKHGTDVLAVGSSPEEAMTLARQRAENAKVAPSSEPAPPDTALDITGAEATTSSEPGTTPIVAGENTPEIPPPPVEAPPAPVETPKTKARAKLKPAAQEVLSKADQKLAAARAAGEAEPPAEPKAASAPETPPVLAKLVKKSVAAKAAKPAPPETPAERKARIAREVKGEFEETAAPPASATAAARGMEDIEAVSEAEANKAPTKTSDTVSVAEARGEEPSDLESQQMAASTTSKPLIAEKLLKDTLAGRMSVIKAYNEYGEPAPKKKGGRTRTYATFMDFLKARIERARDPKALDDLVARANAGESVAHEFERLGDEQDNLDHMQRMHDQLEDALAKRAAKRAAAGGEAEDPAEAAFRKMQEANARGLKSEDTADELGQRRRQIEDLPDVNIPVAHRADESARTGTSHDLHDYFDDIIGNPNTRRVAPHFVALAKALKRVIPHGVQVFGDDNLRSQAHYDPDTGHIRINTNAESPTRAVLHEAVHVATAHFLTDVGGRMQRGEAVTKEERRVYKGLDLVAREIDALRQGLDPAVGAGRGAELALSREHNLEVVTYAMTSPDLMAHMARTEASPELLRALRRLGMAPRGQQSSLFATFKAAIGKVFGLTPERTSVLDAVMRPLNETVETGARYRRGVLDEHAADLRGFASGTLFDRPTLPRGSKLTDGLPADLREKLSDFGDKVQGFDDRGVLHSNDTTRAEIWRRLKERYDPGGGGRWLRATILPASTTDEIARYNSDVLPQAAAIRDARAKQAATALSVREQWGDRVSRWARQLTAAGRDFEQLRVDASMLQASLAGRDFAADNAHLSPEDRAAARGLKAKFDALPADQQELYRNLRDYHQETGWAERQAGFEHLVQRALGDVTPAERAELGRIVRSKSKLDEMVENPDATPLAQMMADRWAPSRGIVQELAKAQRKGWMRGDYSPLQRHGDYIVSYGDPEDPSTYGVHFFDRKGQAEQFRADNAHLNPSPVKLKSTTGSNRYREFMPDTMISELKRAMELRGIKGDEAESFLDAFSGMMLQHAAQSSAARYNVRRRNVLGASTEGAQNLVRDFSAHASRMGYLHNAADEGLAYMQADKHIQQMRRQTGASPAEIAASRARLDALEQRFANKDPEVSQAEIEDRRQQHAWLEKPPDVIRAGQVFDELKMRRTPIDGDDTSRLFGTIARRFTSASFVMHLMRPAHLLVQTLDAWANAQSFLGAKYGHVATGAALARAMTQLAPEGMRAGARNMMHAVSGKMEQSDWMLSRVFEQRLVAGGMHPEEAKALIQAANDRGLIDMSMERELQRMAHPGGFSFGGDALTRAGHVAGNMMDLFAAGGHAVDALNRTAILKAGYDLARRSGADVQTAIRDAVDQASRAQPNYGLWNKPRIATERGPLKNPLISATMQYKIYGMHLYSVMGSLVKQAATRPAERAEALKALAGLVATHSLLVGAAANMFGVPVNALTGVWDLLHGKPGPHNYETDLRRWSTENLGPTTTTFLDRGVLGLAGIDLNRSLKLSNMVDVPELRSFDRAGVAGAFATAITGASGEVAQQVTDATHQLFAGNFKRAAIELLPRMASDAIKAHQLATEGMVDTRGNTIVPASRLSTSSPALRALGFNPMETSRIYDQRNAIEEWERENQDARTKAEDAFVQSRDMSRVRAFNVDKELNGGRPIKPADLLRALKNQRDRVANPATYGVRVQKTVLPAAVRMGQFS